MGRRKRRNKHRRNVGNLAGWTNSTETRCRVFAGKGMTTKRDQRLARIVCQLQAKHPDLPSYELQRLARQQLYG